MTSRRPSRISRDRFAVGLGGGGASSCRIVPRRSADTRNDTASRAIAIGAVRSWTRKPLTPKAMNSDAEPLAASAASHPRGARVRRSSAGRRCRPSRRSVVRIAARPETARSCQNVRTPKANASGTEPRSAARPRSAQIRTGRRRSRSTQAPATSPTTSVAPSSSAAQDGDLERAGAQDEDRRERQRDPGDERAEDGDRRRAPDAHERRVSPERGTEGIAHERGAYRPWVAGTPDHRPSGVATACATLRLPRCVRTRAPPGSAVRRTGPPPDGVLPGPCSTR